MIAQNGKFTVISQLAKFAQSPNRFVESLYSHHKRHVKTRAGVEERRDTCGITQMWSTREKESLAGKRRILLTTVKIGKELL